MPRVKRVKTEAAKDSLLRRVRKQRLKYITVLPSLITILNGVCGFAAIVFASKGAAVGSSNFSYDKLQLPYFALAAYMILLALIADMLDGRLARISKSTSSFGGQLDSLCDIISFGVAPAFLMLKILEEFVRLEELNPIATNLLQRFIWLAAAAYVSCAAIRLARFNVENEQDESAHMSFVGLPSPAAAGVIASLVIFHQETLLGHPGKLAEISANSSQTYLLCRNVMFYTLPFLTLGLAVLMVSRIRYPHILNKYMKGKKPLAYLLMCMLGVGLVIWFRQPALVLGFCGFAASSFVKWLYGNVIRRKTAIKNLEPLKAAADQLSEQYGPPPPQATVR